MRVLVVCSGNICRSPMAAAYLRHRGERAGLKLDVGSAGLLGIEGERISRWGMHVLARHGIDARDHRSRGIVPGEIQSARLVLVMTPEHRRQILAMDPSAEGRVFLLRAFEGGPRPVPEPPPLEDPIGKPEEAYEECFRIVRSCVDHIVEALGSGSWE